MNLYTLKNKLENLSKISKSKLFFEETDKLDLRKKGILIDEAIKSPILDCKQKDKLINEKNDLIKKNDSDFLDYIIDLIKGNELLLAVNEQLPDESEPLIEDLQKIINENVNEKKLKEKIAIIGAGPSGLSAAYELKRRGANITIFEASTRVGGRMRTIREPFPMGLHSEGGAMRIPSNHKLINNYIAKFRLQNELVDFQQKNKLIYLSPLKENKRLKYDEFDSMLKNRDTKILDLFPNLDDEEKGKTIDELWGEAIEVPNEIILYCYKKTLSVELSYQVITLFFDGYTLSSYFTDFSDWSQDCVNLYDLGSPHVVLDNAFIESWKDGFLSSQKGGADAKMKQLVGGIDTLTHKFIVDQNVNLEDNIIYGAKVQSISTEKIGKLIKSTISYYNGNSIIQSEKFDKIIFAIPFTALRLIKTDRPFSNEKYNAIRNVRYVDVTKVLLEFNERWWENLSVYKDGTGGGLVTDLPIRYTMFPNRKSLDDGQELTNRKRSTIMASYSFQQDARIMGSNSNTEMIRIALRDLKDIFEEHKHQIDSSFEVGTAQVWSSDISTCGGAFAYFSPRQKTIFYKSMNDSEWENTAFFIGEHNSFSHGWIEGAFESALRTVKKIIKNA